ncbi:MAG: TlpA family protein disulfide reductase [Pseudomonadota bacterium]|nr:TlpA family protein disulfide reductase [Pseudomonadota bacterium]
MKRRTFVIASALGIITTGAGGTGLKRWNDNFAAPPINLLSINGAPISLQQLRGKVVLVNFWATWCEPCVTEMPVLQRLHDELGAEGFEVLAVNYQEGPARIGAFLKKMNLTFAVVRDTDGGVARRWGARVFPASYLVDRDGNIRHSISGAADWTSPPLVSTIRSLLGAQRSR